MQSPFSYASPPSSPYYSSSPGGMDFFFYGPQPVYDNLSDLEPASPFGVPEVGPEVFTFTSAPYNYSPVSTEFSFYDVRPMPPTSVPSSASSNCGSSCASPCASSSGWNLPEEVPMPKYPIAPSETSCPDSPPPVIKPAKPFGCKDCKKSFTRFADLKRHQSSVHYPVFRNCPVEHCSRKGSNGFPRQDHLVEHLRSYHHLDVPKRRAFKRSAKYIS